jgi:hypothetical protein
MLPLGPCTATMRGMREAMAAASAAPPLAKAAAAAGCMGWTAGAGTPTLSAVDSSPLSSSEVAPVLAKDTSPSSEVALEARDLHNTAQRDFAETSLRPGSLLAISAQAEPVRLTIYCWKQCEPCVSA